MSDTLQLDIVTPYGTVFSGEVSEVTARGSEGEFGVYPGHVSFMTALNAGMLTCLKDGKPMYFFVSWGFAEATASKLLILADSAERAEDINVERAEEARKRAEEKVRKQEEVEFASAEAALERATSRIHVSQHAQK